MAAEYSRELSDKVFAGMTRVVRRGFRSGAHPGYGFRRLLLSADGIPRQQLSIGEQKSIATDRVVLVPGPANEVMWVREIYRLFISDVIVDNYATHKHPRVKRWLAARPRFHVHFTPTYASWLNHLEIWFNRITQRAIRRGTFRSVKELVAKIDQFVENDNQNARPFAWTATADSIFAKVQRLCERISGTGH